MPLILYSSQKLINGHKLNIVGFAVGSALLIMTHLPTFIIFYPVTIGYILFIAGRRRIKKALIRMSVAIALGIGLSGIYWLPAMTTQQYISMSAIREGIFYFKKNFLFVGPAVHGFETFWRYLEVLTLLMGGLAWCSFLIARTNSIETCRRESYYWIFIAMISLFMTLPLSRPVWEVVHVIQRIQFPWRFNTVLTVATTALLALAISNLKEVVYLTTKKFLAIGSLLGGSLLLSVVELWPFMQQKIHFPINTVSLVTITAILTIGISSLKKPINLANNKKYVIGVLLIISMLLSSLVVIKTCLHRPSNRDVDTALEISRDAMEYRPRWVSPEMFEPGYISKLGRSSAKASVTVGQGSLLIQRWQPREIVLQANATTDIWVTINQFYYPGWTARLNGESYLLPVQSPEGLLRIRVPSGKHSVIVRLDAGVEERVGKIISAVSVFFTLFSLFWLGFARTV